jgi:hypothetical protein
MGKSAKSNHERRVLSVYIFSKMGNRLARNAYSPLRNSNGLDYFELRERAIWDGRIIF